MNTIHILSSVSVRFNEDDSVNEDGMLVRNLGLFANKHLAEATILNNLTGIYNRLYNLAVIEEVKTGTLFPFTLRRSWYKWSHEENGYNLVTEESEIERYKKIGSCFFD